MTPNSEDDPLARGLAALPAVAIDPQKAELVRRSAREELVSPAGAVAPGRRLALLWSQTVLPGVLLASGAAYTWGAVQMLGRIYLSG